MQRKITVCKGNEIVCKHVGNELCSVGTVDIELDRRCTLKNQAAINVRNPQTLINNQEFATYVLVRSQIVHSFRFKINF